MGSSIVLIGTGNVACILGKKLVDAGHRILQVAGRNSTQVSAIATSLKAESCIGFENIFGGADMYIVAVADTALLEIDKWLPITERLIVHTAGSVSMEVLKNHGKQYGILYPFQSIRADRPDVDIPFLINGNSAESRQNILALANTISNNVQITDDATRAKLHIGAVTVNNFVNHLYTLTADYCQKENLSFDLLFPLMQETFSRLHQFAPAEMQTGPAIRGDSSIIEKHITALTDYPALQSVYKSMTTSIINWYQIIKR